MSLNWLGQAGKEIENDESQNKMKVKIIGTPKEIAALALEVQERQVKQLLNDDYWKECASLSYQSVDRKSSCDTSQEKSETAHDRVPTRAYISDYKIHQPLKIENGKLFSGKLVVEIDVHGGTNDTDKYQNIIDGVRILLNSLT